MSSLLWGQRQWLEGGPAATHRRVLALGTVPGRLMSRSLRLQGKGRGKKIGIPGLDWGKGTQAQHYQLVIRWTTGLSSCATLHTPTHARSSELMHCHFRSGGGRCPGSWTTWEAGLERSNSPMILSTCTQQVLTKYFHLGLPKFLLFFQ